MAGKRTDVDFSEHELTIVETENFNSYRLKKPNTILESLTFINTNGVMLVTGDYGNWVFCRGFQPTHGGRVSDHYWCEKLQISSEQEPYEYSSDKTVAAIKEGINGGLAEYGYEGRQLSDALAYYRELRNYTDSEFEYTSYAFNNVPYFMDTEQVPFCREIKVRLKVVFDAFEEICSRIEKKVEKVLAQ